MCLTPVILIGALLTVNTSWHKTTNMDGPVAEIQTCRTGLGAHARAAGSGLYAAGIHYGAEVIAWNGFAFTLQPRFGASYADHAVPELPLRTQFEVGVSAMLTYRQAVISVDYWHLSNAGLRQPNVGLDLIGVMGGVSF